MINNGTRVAMVGAALIAVLSLGGLIGLPEAFGVPPDPNEDALALCLLRNVTPDTSGIIPCCPAGVETNAHEAIACILSACGPGCISEPPGSMAVAAELVQALFGVGRGKDAGLCNPCVDVFECLARVQQP